MRKVVFGLAFLGIAAGASAAPFTATCKTPGKVSLDVDGTPIRIVLQDLALQARARIGQEPHLTGHITARFECLDLEKALRLVLPQAHAQFCQQRGIILVVREGSPSCEHAEPAAPQHVSRR